MFDPQHNTPNRRMSPAAPARHHVQQLIAIGYTPAAVAHHAGLERRRVELLLAGLTERGGTRKPGYEHRIHRRIADALLAVPIPDSRFTEATGTARRIRALVRLGHPFDRLANELGCGDTQLRELALGRPLIVDAELAERVTSVYDRWYLTPGASSDAREFGQRHRFAAPLAWAVDDDDTAGAIDDPAALPIGMPPAGERAFRRVPADFADIVAEHRDLGHFDEDIAAALHLTLEAFVKRLHRAGLRERRRGNGNHLVGPAYGPRYVVRLPARMARPLAGIAS